MYCEIPAFARCCCCFPLRKGVLVFGYLNLLFSMFMVGLFSFLINASRYDRHGEMPIFYHGSTTFIPAEVTVTIYCVEIIFNCILLYGAHKSIVLYLRVYWYFVITSIAAALILQIIDISKDPYVLRLIEILLFLFTGLFLQTYLAILVSSLIRKLDVGDSNRFDNQLHQVLSGEKIENGVYDDTVMPN